MASINPNPVFYARRNLFSENATNLDVSVSDTRFNDISAGTRHLLRSTGQFGTVLNTVDLSSDLLYSLMGGKRLLFIIQTGNHSPIGKNESSSLTTLEREWKKHITRNVLRSEARKEINNANADVFTTYSLFSGGTIGIVSDNLSRGIYSGIVILDRRESSQITPLNDFFLQWGEHALALRELISNNIHETSNQQHIFVALLSDSTRFTNDSEIKEQYSDFLEGKINQTPLKNISFLLPLCEGETTNKFAYEMACIFELTRRLADGKDPFDESIINSQDVIYRRAYDASPLDEDIFKKESAAVANSSFILVRKQRCNRKPMQDELSIPSTHLPNLCRIPEIQKLHKKGLEAGHLTYKQAKNLEVICQEIWRTSLLHFNTNSLFKQRFGAIFFALNLTMLTIKKYDKKNRNLDNKKLQNFEPDKGSLKSLWDEFQSDSSDALFSLDVFNYEWKQDERNQLRFIKAILYGSPSDRVHPILREKIEKVICEITNHSTPSIGELSEYLEDIGFGDETGNGGSAYPLVYAVCLEKEFLTVLEKAMDTHSYLYASPSNRLGWDDKVMPLFRGRQRSDVVMIDEFEKKYLKRLDRALQNIDESLIFEKHSNDMVVAKPRWVEMMINYVEDLNLGE